MTRTRAAKTRATQMAKVLVHYAKGGAIEAMAYDHPQAGYQETNDCPVNWAMYHYRIKTDNRRKR